MHGEESLDLLIGGECAVLTSSSLALDALEVLLGKLDIDSVRLALHRFLLDDPTEGIGLT